MEQYWNQSAVGNATSKSGWSMSKIFGTATKWFIYLFFIAAAVNVLQFTQVSQAINNVWLWVPNVIAFLIVLVIGSLLADFVGSYLQRELPKRGIIGGKLIGLAMTGILYAIVLTVAVTQLGIGETILNNVITALVWGMTAALATGFGAGQKISYKDHTGIIQEVGAFSLILKEEDEGKTIVLPTKYLMDDEIIIESGPSLETQEKMVERSSAEAA